MAGAGGCGNEVQLAKGWGRDPLFPVGAVQLGSPEGALSGGAERGVVACDFGLQAPSLIPAPPQVAPGRAPSPPRAGPFVVTGGGAKPSGPHYPQPWPLPEHRGPGKGWSVRWRGTRVWGAAPARGGSLNVPMTGDAHGWPHNSWCPCVELP